MSGGDLYAETIDTPLRVRSFGEWGKVDLRRSLHLTCHYDLSSVRKGQRALYLMIIRGSIRSRELCSDNGEDIGVYGYACHCVQYDTVSSSSETGPNEIIESHSSIRVKLYVYVSGVERKAGSENGREDYTHRYGMDGCCRCGGDVLWVLTFLLGGEVDLWVLVESLISGRHEYRGGHTHLSQEYVDEWGCSIAILICFVLAIFVRSTLAAVGIIVLGSCRLGTRNLITINLHRELDSPSVVTGLGNLGALEWIRMKFSNKERCDIAKAQVRLTFLERQEVWNNCRSCKVRVGSNGNLLWEASVFGAKRKLSRCGRNQMGNEPTLALPEGANDFVVYYDARSKELEACSDKERRLTNQWLSMKKDIASCGSKYLAYSEVEVEYQGSSGLLLQPELLE
ncbi:hypothetical protein Tco_0475051 [Tanacetum coccineum]